MSKNVDSCIKGNASSKIEACRTKLLRAELYYRSTENEMIDSGYKGGGYND